MAPGQNISADYLSNIWQSDCCTNWQLKQKRIFAKPVALQHPRQVRKASAAWIVHIVRLLLWAVGGDFVEPIDQLAVPSAFPQLNAARDSDQRGCIWDSGHTGRQVCRSDQ